MDSNCSTLIPERQASRDCGSPLPTTLVRRLWAGPNARCLFRRGASTYWTLMRVAGSAVQAGPSARAWAGQIRQWSQMFRHPAQGRFLERLVTGFTSSHRKSGGDALLLEKRLLAHQRIQIFMV